MAQGFKNDSEARALWGSEVYAAIPKSVFAVACWHLAELAGGGEQSAIERLIEEIDCLDASSCIASNQASAAIKALKKAGASA